MFRRGDRLGFLGPARIESVLGDVVKAWLNVCVLFIQLGVILTDIKDDARLAEQAKTIRRWSPTLKISDLCCRVAK